MSDPAIVLPPDPDAEAFTGAAAWKELKKKQHPQKTIDDFWAKFVSKNPGKLLRVLPDDLYAKRAAAKVPEGAVPAHDATSSFEEAVASCKAKVDKIRKECQRINQKYTDPHFDIESDLWAGGYDFLSGLTRPNPYSPGPASTKRVPVRIQTGK